MDIETDIITSITSNFLMDPKETGPKAAKAKARAAKTTKLDERINESDSEGFQTVKVKDGEAKAKPVEESKQKENCILNSVERLKARMEEMFTGKSNRMNKEQIAEISPKRMERIKKRRVAVIGSGFTGINAIKHLKEEEGMEPVCFEATEHFGGTWRYHNSDVEGLASVMSSTVINHSKEMGSFSDFPPPKEFPNYMPHHLILEYLSRFAEKFDVLRHIRYNMEVMKVQKADNYDITGRWTVTVKNRKTGDIFSEVFDSVMVAVGHSTHPKIPQFEGIKLFKGKLMHTHSLKGVEEFRNQRVAVIGIGNSGIDAAVEISNVADQVYLSTRRGAWIMPRIGPYGLPFDYLFLRRWVVILMHIFSVDFLSRCFEKLLLNTRFDHSLYGLEPNHRFLGQNPAISDALPSKLISSDVIIKRNIDTFTEEGIHFQGDDEVTKLDAVILATGYEWKYPFLEDGIVTTTGNRINLYKCVYPPHLGHPTLGIFGFVQPFGGGFPLGEAQIRWHVQLLKGTVKLPDEAEMRASIEEQYNSNAKRYLPSDTLSIQVDYTPYLDDITSQFGAKPNLLKMAFTDPVLFWNLLTGPSLPYQYRLQGPNPWPGAREAIFTSKERIKALFVKGQFTAKENSKKRQSVTFFLGLLLVCWIALFLSH